jgi:hypothetical protein
LDKGIIDFSDLTDIEEMFAFEQREYICYMKRDEDYTCTASPIEVKSKKDILQMLQYVESSNESKLRLVLTTTVVDAGRVSVTPLKL